MTTMQKDDVNEALRRMQELKVKDTSTSDAEKTRTSNSSTANNSNNTGHTTAESSRSTTGNSSPDLISGVTYIRTDHEEIDIQGGAHSEVYFVGCKSKDCLFADCTFENVTFRNCSMTGLRFHNVTLRDMEFEECHFKNPMWADLKDEQGYHCQEDFDGTLFGEEAAFDGLNGEIMGIALGLKEAEVEIDRKAWKEIQKRAQSGEAQAKRYKEGSDLPLEDLVADYEAWKDREYDRKMQLKWGSVPTTDRLTVFNEPKQPGAASHSFDKKAYAPHRFTAKENGMMPELKGREGNYQSEGWDWKDAVGNSSKGKGKADGEILGVEDTEAKDGK